MSTSVVFTHPGYLGNEERDGKLRVDPPKIKFSTASAICALLFHRRYEL